MYIYIYVAHIHIYIYIYMQCILPVAIAGLATLFAASPTAASELLHASPAPLASILKTMEIF